MWLWWHGTQCGNVCQLPVKWETKHPFSKQTRTRKNCRNIYTLKNLLICISLGHGCLKMSLKWFFCTFCHKFLKTITVRSAISVLTTALELGRCKAHWSGDTMHHISMQSVHLQRWHWDTSGKLNFSWSRLSVLNSHLRWIKIVSRERPSLVLP